MSYKIDNEKPERKATVQIHYVLTGSKLPSSV